MADKEAKNTEGIDYSELVDFLSEKFDHEKQEILSGVKEALETKADKSDIENVRKELKSDIENVRKELKSDITSVLTRINRIGNNVDDHRSEQLETRRKVDIHDKWIAKAAPKIGIKIEK